MKYRVELSARAIVLTTVEVEATSLADAERVALEKAYDGNCEWAYDGCDSETAQVDNAEESQSRDWLPSGPAAWPRNYR